MKTRAWIACWSWPASQKSTMVIHTYSIHIKPHLPFSELTEEGKWISCMEGGYREGTEFLLSHPHECCRRWVLPGCPFSWGDAEVPRAGLKAKPHSQAPKLLHFEYPRQSPGSGNPGQGSRCSHPEQVAHLFLITESAPRNRLNDLHKASQEAKTRAGNCLQHILGDTGFEFWHFYVAS